MNRIVKNSLIAICLFSVMIACKEETTQEIVVRSVKIEQLSSKHQLSSTISLPASVNELSDTKLSFRVGGPLVKLNDVVGRYVRKGEVIARVDQRDFKIGVQSTKSVYELAKVEYERFKNLVDKESVSKSAFDGVETQYKTSKAAYESASNALVDTEIKAPFSGYINSVFVNNFESVAPGQPIVSLLDMSEYEIGAWISVRDASKIDDATLYTCIVKQGDKEYRIPGKLKEIGNKTSITKQSLPITVVIDSQDGLKLRAGVTTYLEISTSNSDSNSDSDIQVMPSSLFTKNGNTYVWIFNETTNSVSSKQVSTGKITKSGAMEIRKGLQGNEMIVTAGVNYLFEGQEVKRMKSFSKSNVGNKI